MSAPPAPPPLPDPHPRPSNVTALARTHMAVNSSKREEPRQTMSMLELGPVIFGGNDGIICWMRTHHLLAGQANCSRLFFFTAQNTVDC